MASPVDIMATAFQDELVKIAAHRKSAAGAGALKGLVLPMVAGAALYETARRAERDRRMGHAMRIQQTY